MGAEMWIRDSPKGLRVDALRLINKGWKLAGLEPVQAKNAFLQRYKTLMKAKTGNAWWVELDMDTKYIQQETSK